MDLLSFRPLGVGDLRLMHEWLQREHVRRWWSKHETYESVVEHYLPAIQGRKRTAEEELIGRGLGTEALRAFVREVVFANPETTACVADPDVRNVASIRAFEKPGFRCVRDFFDPYDDELHALVRLERIY